jgi:hypothetical protein
MRETLGVFLIGAPIAIGASWFFSQFDSWDRERTQERLNPVEYEARAAISRDDRTEHREGPKARPRHCVNSVGGDGAVHGAASRGRPD